MSGPEGMRDEDFTETMRRALRLLVALALVAGGLVWWKLGWASAALLGVGAAVSGSGLWEWRRLMERVMERMDAGATARPMGAVLAGFFVRLGLVVVVLYTSVKYLNGSVFALAAGLGLGVVALSVEALRLARSWTGA